MAEKNVHTGHFSRLREEFISSGLDSFNDIRTLELLLSFSCVRSDVNPIAHALLEKYKTLDGVFEASYDDLLTVYGVGPALAAMICFIPELSKKAHILEPKKKSRSFKTTEKAGAYIRTLIGHESDERFLLFCLDSKLKLIRFHTVQEGTVNRVNVDIRKVVELALSTRASVCMIAHNHPDGGLEPSAEDLNVTDRLSDALRLVSIPLADHFIVSAEGFYSFKEHGKL